jgi:hypothetical protein
VLSDLNWFTFGLVASLGRLAAQEATVAATAPAQATLPAPTAAWQAPSLDAINSFAIAQSWKRPER